MSNDLQKHKTADTVKWILTLLAFIIVGIMLAGIICGWFDKNEPYDTEQEIQQTETADGLSIASNNIGAISLTVTPLSAAALSDSGIMTLADSGYTSYTVTATITPSTALNKAVDWSAEWVETNSTNVSDYITVTPTSDGSLTATVTCIKAFTGEIA